MVVLYEFWVLELTQYGHEERMGVGWRKENKCFLTVSWLNLVSKGEFSRFLFGTILIIKKKYAIFSLVPLCSCLSNEHGKEGNWHFLRICYMSGIYATLFYIRQPYGELFLFYSRASWDAKRWSYLPKLHDKWWNQIQIQGCLEPMFFLLQCAAMVLRGFHTNCSLPSVYT